MTEKKYKNFLNVVLVIVILAIIGVSSYIFYEYIYLKNVIDASANDILEAFDKYINDINKNTDLDNSSQGAGTNNNDNNSTEETANNSNAQRVNTGQYNYSGSINNTYGNEYPLTYKGYGVLGKIELPTVGLKYPVLETLTDANAIDVSVAMQYGVGLNQVGNTVIMGHNYRNGSFFGSNKRLSEGDKVYITDNSGTRIEYTIYKKYLTEEADYSYAQRDTNGKREVTLVTCHTDNRYRLVIFAKET